MELILLQKVDNLGNLGDIVNVKPGYARNFLVPTGRALRATDANKIEFEQRRNELEMVALDHLTAAQARKVAIDELHEIEIGVAAGGEGKLYGSVGPAEIADVLTSAGIETGKSEVRMPEGPIRNVGEYEIDIHLHAEVDATVTIIVSPEEVQ